MSFECICEFEEDDEIEYLEGIEIENCFEMIEE